MNQKIIPCQVRDEQVLGAGVTVGAEGSGYDTVLQLEFGAMWDGLVKYVTFRNALGEDPAVALLTTDMIERLALPGRPPRPEGCPPPEGGCPFLPRKARRQEEGGGEEEEARPEFRIVYNVPIPPRAKALAGQMPVTVQGYSLNEDGSQLETATMTATAYFRVLPAQWAMAEEGFGEDPTVAQQMQAQIEDIRRDIIAAAQAADAKEAARESAEEARQAAQLAGERQAGAEQALTQAQQAQAGAEQARSEAEKAQAEAEKARAGAEEQACLAGGFREQSRAEANRAEKAQAEAAQMVAQAEAWARGTSWGASVEAGTPGFQDNARYYKGLADQARSGAEAAQRKADQAQSAAEAGAEAAQTARQQIQTALNQAREAQGAAQTAAREAQGCQEAAQTSQDGAQAAAEQAEYFAAQAKEAAGGEFVTSSELTQALLELAQTPLMGPEKLTGQLKNGGILFITEGGQPEEMVSRAELESSWELEY